MLAYPLSPAHVLGVLQLRDLDPSLIELFVDGKEDGLPDAGRLDALGLGSGSVVFMLHRPGWRWQKHKQQQQQQQQQRSGRMYC